MYIVFNIQAYFLYGIRDTFNTKEYFLAVFSSL